MLPPQDPTLSSQIKVEVAEEWGLGVGRGGSILYIYGWLSKLWSFFGYPKY